MGDIVNAFFQVLYMPFTVFSFTFCLMDVFFTSLFLGVLGLFIGKVIFFALGKR